MTATLLDDLFDADEPWRADAACRDLPTDLFFPYFGLGPQESRQHDKERRVMEKRAVAVCRRCSVRSDCLMMAVENDLWYGIFGGVRFHNRDDRREARRKVKGHGNP